MGLIQTGEIKSALFHLAVLSDFLLTMHSQLNLNKGSNSNVGQTTAGGPRTVKEELVQKEDPISSV